MMSEYEQMRQEVLREAARARRAAALKKAAFLLFFLLAVWLVAGYFAHVRLPLEIARLEKGIALTRESDNLELQKSEANRAKFKQAWTRAGLPMPQAGAIRGTDVRGLAGLLQDPLLDDGFYRGVRTAVAPRILANRLLSAQNQLGKAEKELPGKRNRVAMLSREFEGRLGKGSKDWQNSMQRAEAELAATEARVARLRKARDVELKGAWEFALELDHAASIPVRVGDLEPLEHALEVRRTWLNRLRRWPVTLSQGIFRTGKGE